MSERTNNNNRHTDAEGSTHRNALDGATGEELSGLQPFSLKGVQTALPTQRLPQLVAVQASVDWLRMTRAGPLEEGDEWESIRSIAREVATETLEGMVPEETPYSLRGFSGSRFAGCAWGRKSEWFLLDAYGGFAQTLAQRRVIFDNIPRLDIQVTLVFSDDIASTLIYSALLDFQASKPKSGKKAGWRYLNSDKGDTLYVGSRTSKRMMRIYDKGRQGGLTHHALRVEFQLHDAVPDYQFLYANDFEPGAVAFLVRRHAQDYNLDWLIPVEAFGEVDQYRSFSDDLRHDDAEKRMRWLRTTVRGAIMRQLNEGTSRDDVLRALGLEDHHDHRIW